MSETSVSYSTNLQGLVDIQNKLYTAPIAQMPELDGMFHRVQDFTLSHANLMKQFVQEYMIAHMEFPKSKDADGLMSNVSRHREMEVYSLGKDHFTSRELAPALRHFVNDSCRLLEPTMPLLAAKFADVAPTQSMGSYVTRLQSAGRVLGFDAQFIIELYEVWNDYKHRETTGLQVSAWRYESGNVINPKLELPRLRITMQKLSDINVDSFVYQTDGKILEFLNFTI